MSYRFTAKLCSVVARWRRFCSTGPGLKDFIASAAPAREEWDDSQWDGAPYLQEKDFAARGRKGKITGLPEGGGA